MSDVRITRGERALGIESEGVEIARYVFRDDADAFEGPKPFLHPVRTLSGAVVTGFRPWDHRWHKGLQMTLTDVSGENFWGGNTYVRGEGYVARDNVGRIRHDRFTAAEDGEAGEAATVGEELTWITQAGEPWLSERRTQRFRGGPDGVWTLDVATTLTSIADRELVLGSPTTNGRENAGYSGMFLRLARSFQGGSVTVPSGDGTVTRADADVDELMGATAPWLAFSGPLDEVDGSATILAFAGASTGAPAIRWFVRSQPIAVLAPSPTFSETVTLAPGDELSLTHRFVIADGTHTGDDAATLAARVSAEG